MDGYVIVQLSPSESSWDLLDDALYKLDIQGGESVVLMTPSLLEQLLPIPSRKPTS